MFLIFSFGGKNSKGETVRDRWSLFSSDSKRSTSLLDSKLRKIWDSLDTIFYRPWKKCEREAWRTTDRYVQMCGSALHRRVPGGASRH